MENRLPLAEGQSRSEDQRYIKGIFSKLSIHEASSSRESAAMLTKEKGQQGDLPRAEVDLDMESDNDILDQSRESFYSMAREDVKLQ